MTPARPFSPQRLALAALAMLVPGGGGDRAHAETSASFDVTASIVPGCLVDGLGSSGDAGLIGILDFGEDSSLSTATHGAALASTQTIRLRCTPGVEVTMGIDGGAHADAGSRHLQRGTDTAARIVYTLCSDAACAQPIAIGADTAITVTGANSDDVRLPLFASLTLPGALPPGTYSDTLTVTLSW